MREGTRLYLKHIVESLEEDRSTERLGRSGITLYSCSGYVSPLHCDKDCTDGYCWCEQWDANRGTDDFAFVLAEYGYYFCTESNCLWLVITLIDNNLILNFYIGQSMDHKLMLPFFQHLVMQKILIWHLLPLGITLVTHQKDRMQQEVPTEQQ